MINETLGSFLSDLQTQRNDRKPDEDDQTRLEAILSGNNPSERLVYDGQNIKAEYLSKLLAPFCETRIGYGETGRIKSLLDWLPYIAMYEEGGIEALNQRIKELLQELKTPGLEIACQEELIKKLNHLIHQIIYFLPHKLKSVEVRLKPNVLGKCGQYWDIYGPNFAQYRDVYDSLVKQATERQIANFDPSVLRVPLPYWVIGRNCGSGDGWVPFSSSEQIIFDMVTRKGNDGQIPALGISLCANSSSDRTFFKLGEIEDVELSDSEDYTPWDVGRARRPGEDLKKRESWTSYYLFLRGFRYDRASRKREAKRWKKVADADWDRVQKLLMESLYHGSRYFWRHKWGMRGFHYSITRLERGFLAMAEDYGDTLLYELNDIWLPYHETHDAAMKLVLLIESHNKNILEKTKVYSGDDVVKRLYTVPVHENKY